MLEADGLAILARLKRSSMLPVKTISTFSCCTVGRTAPGKSTAGHGRLPRVSASAEYALLELLVPQLNAGKVPLMLLSATPIQGGGRADWSHRSPGGSSGLDRNQAADFIAHKTDQRGVANAGQGDHVVELINKALKADPVHGIAAAQIDDLDAAAGFHIALG